MVHHYVARPDPLFQRLTRRARRRLAASTALLQMAAQPRESRVLTQQHLFDV
jgi:hypothetical protein